MFWFTVDGIVISYRASRFGVKTFSAKTDFGSSTTRRPSGRSNTKWPTLFVPIYLASANSGGALGPSDVDAILDGARNWTTAGFI